jgi:hypothetical protein
MSEADYTDPRAPGSACRGINDHCSVANFSNMTPAGMVANAVSVGYASVSQAGGVANRHSKDKSRNVVVIHVGINLLSPVQSVVVATVHDGATQNTLDDVLIHLVSPIAKALLALPASRNELKKMENMEHAIRKNKRAAGDVEPVLLPVLEVLFKFLTHKWPKAHKIGFDADDGTFKMPLIEFTGANELPVHVTMWGTVGQDMAPKVRDPKVALACARVEKGRS